MELVIEGRAFYDGKLQSCAIGVDKGRIVAVKKVLKGERHLDFNDRIILPAAIDPHVHFRDPGMTKKEDFETGSVSALFGGVSCVFDMPNTKPPLLLREDLLEKWTIATRKSWTDFGLFGGCSDASDPLRLSKGVIGYKVFMSSTTGSVLLAKDEEIKRALDAVKPTGKVVSVHAEDDHMIPKQGDKMRKEERNLRDHNEARPMAAEASAIRRLVSLGQANKINTCHVTSNDALEALKGADFTCEATAHHMLLDIGCGKGAFGKVNPPLRRKEDKEALFAAFCAGKIDMLASDHAPHTTADKEEDFDFAPSGMPGVETAFPLMMTFVKREQMSLATLVRAACERPAEIFGLNKGKIAVGRDADLMVLDPREMVQISARKLHSKCGWTAFEGFEAIFPQSTFLRGKMLTEDGALVGERMGRDVVVMGKANTY